MFRKEKTDLIGCQINKSILTLFIIGSLSLLIVASMWAESVPIEVNRAAKDGLAQFLNAVREGELKDFGFTSKDEFASTTVGSPYRIFTITPNDILSFKEGDDISSIVSPTNLWLFPVVCSGKARTLLTVDFFEGEWRAVNLGASYLATEMNRVSDYLSQFNDYEIQFVRVFQASSDFMLLTKDKVSKIVPLESTAFVVGLIDQGEIYTYSMKSPSEIISRLIPVIKKIR